MVLLGNKKIAAALLVLALLPGCASPEGSYPVIGAGTGAAAGGMVGAATGDPTTAVIGAAIGAPIGGLLGGMFAGNQKKTRQKEYNRGYDNGRSDAIKSQYWMAQRLQEGSSKQQDYRVTYYTLPSRPETGIKTVPYEVTVPILKPR